MTESAWLRRGRSTRTLLAPALLIAALSACDVVRDSTDEHDRTALMRAARDGDAAEVARLFGRRRGARVNQAVRGHGTLRELAAFIAWMQQLPARDPGYRALHYAVLGGHVEAARLLLAAGAEAGAGAVAREGATPLSLAASGPGRPPTAPQVLLEAGVPARTPGTATYAASSGSMEVLRLVHEAGADLRESDDEPLRTAAIAGGVETMRYLLERGARVDAADGLDRTPLGRAVAFRKHDAVRVLLEAGADPRQRDPESLWTPLMSAAMGGDSLLITLLMDAGADPSARDREGKTAADFARGAGNGHVVPLLERRSEASLGPTTPPPDR